MYSSVQQRVVSSRFTLPVMGFVAGVVWLVLQPVGSSFRSLLLGLSASLAAVYVLAELNNRNVLLRINSRIISSLFAFMLMIALPFHGFQAGHLTLLLSLLSFFSFFLMYQSPHPVLTFLTYLMLSLDSLAFPPVLFLVPVYWLFQAYMRAMSLRCWVSSLLALVMPYWIYLGVLVCLDDYDTISAVCSRFLPSVLGEHLHFWNMLGMPPAQKGLVLYVLLLWLVGVVDFYLKKHRDKARVRILYNIVVAHFVAVLLLLLVCEEGFFQLLPLLMADAAIVGGHFFSQTNNRFSRLFFLAVFLLGCALCSLFYVMPLLQAGG